MKHETDYKKHWEYRDDHIRYIVCNICFRNSISPVLAPVNTNRGDSVMSYREVQLQAENRTLKAREVDFIKLCGEQEEEITTLREAVKRFKTTWEDTASDDSVWEADMEDSRAALFNQVTRENV